MDTFIAKTIVTLMLVVVFIAVVKLTPWFFGISGPRKAAEPAKTRKARERRVAPRTGA